MSLVNEEEERYCKIALGWFHTWTLFGYMG